MLLKSTTKYAVLTVICAVILTFNVNAKDAGTVKDLKIQTNAHCGNCKDKIEKALLKQDGVVKASVNMENKVASVSYNTEKTSEENINKVIADLGYKTNTVDVKNEDHCADKTSSKVSSHCSTKSGSKSDCCKDSKKGIKNTLNDEDCHPEKINKTTEKAKETK